MASYYLEIVLFIYIVCCIIGYMLVGIDKLLAIKGKWRISEATLLLFAFCGGIGVWIAMYQFHHKTRKPKFYLGVPALIILYLGLCLFLLR